MLAFTYYNIESIANLKDFFTVSFVLIDDVFNEIIPTSIKNRRNISKSKLSDSEIITSSLVGEDIRIIGSIPIPVYEFGKAHFSKLFKDIATYR